MKFIFLAAETDIDGVVQEMRLQDTSSSSRIMISGGWQRLGLPWLKVLRKNTK